MGDTLPPGKPTGLLAVVEDSDVALTWEPSLEPDLDHYVVMRDGVRIAVTESPDHRDAGRPNGTYVYKVVAVDHEGLESEPSEPATAVVLRTTPPAAPVILVPTDAAHPITIDTPVDSRLGSRAGRGDRAVVGRRHAHGRHHRGASPRPPGTWPYEGGVLTPDGREVANWGFGGFEYSVRLTPIHGGASRDVAALGFPTVRAISPTAGRLRSTAASRSESWTSTPGTRRRSMPRRATPTTRPSRPTGRRWRSSPDSSFPVSGPPSASTTAPSGRRGSWPPTRVR